MSNIKNYNENLTDKELEKIIKRTNRTEEQKEIKKFLIILLCVVVIVFGFYFFTKDVVQKNNTNNKKEDVVFNYDQIILGELFNRPYDEYYTLIFNSEDVKANYYYSLFSGYKSKEGATKIYYTDLSASMNSTFYTKDGGNVKSTNLDDLKVSDLTLIKIKDKKIVKFFETEEDIEKELGL